jgi:hypothetical protein
MTAKTTLTMLSILSAGLVCTAPAYANNMSPGDTAFYQSISQTSSTNDSIIAIKGGWGKTNHSSSTSTAKQHGVTGGLNLGHRFSQYVGIDLGADVYRKISALTKENFGYHVALTFQVPLGDQLNLYIKAGPAMTSSRFISAGTVNSYTVIANKTYKKFTAYAATGLAFRYDDVSFLIEGSAYNKTKMNATRFGANLGLALHF